MAAGWTRPATAALLPLRGLIAHATDDPAFAALLEHLLAGPGRVLDPVGAGKWPRYVLDTARALGGDRDAAALAAAAVACVVAAADVVDDLADDDWRDPRVAPARALNAAVALGALAHRCADALVPLVGVTRAGRVGDLLADDYLRAASGEDADLRLEADAHATEDAAHRMTERKAGTLVALACGAGAAIAADDPAIRAAVRAFGTHAGIVAQLLNDLAGVAPGDPARGSDLRLRKKTLPVAYALQCAREEGLAPLLAWYGHDAGETIDVRHADEETIAELIRDLGGLAYAGVVAEAHRREALAALRHLLRCSGRPAVSGLRRLIPAVRWRVDPDSAGC